MNGWREQPITEKQKKYIRDMEEFSFYNGGKCPFYYKGQCGLAIQFKVWGEKFRKDLDDAIIYEKEKTE